LTLWKVDIPVKDKRIKQLKTSLVEKVFIHKCEKLSDNKEIIKDIFTPHPKKNRETSKLAFPVNVNQYTNIYVLKKFIFEKITVPKNKDLILWKVDISMNDEKIEQLKNVSSVEEVFNYEYEKCEKLSNITKTIDKELVWMKINDIEVYTKTWKADDPKAYVTFLHSSVDHIGFYDHIFSKFKDNNIEVNAFDRCGHGRTWKKNGNPSVGKGWDVAIKDIKKFVMKQNRKQEAPHFLMGHGV
ncbi:9710_t:CDS:2, partial [Racocetra persica]